MIPLTPLKDLPKPGGFGKNDVFVLFGELFSRGYANGLVDMAKEAGMKIIGITVGRRDKDQKLRVLNDEELTEAEANLGGTIVNLPLWAGFDMDPDNDGITPSERIQEASTSNWEEFKLDWNKIDEAAENGTKRFREACQKAMAQIDALIPKGANVLFAHTMAGGVPRAKLVLVLTNRVVKGRKERYLASDRFWNSDLGQLGAKNFDAVTADTFTELIDASAGIRERVEAAGGQVSYTAYGYHGCEVLINGDYQWQTYNPYLQGGAKKKLEGIISKAREQGIRAAVYNCPEIRTNSSDLFNGVELSLYPLLKSMQGYDTGFIRKQLEACQAKLSDGFTLDEVLRIVNEYHNSDVLQNFYQDFESWPRGSTLEQSELMLTTSEKLFSLNQSKKDTITELLSFLVVQSSGRIMFHDAFDPKSPVVWLGHDIIAKDLATHS